jgi:hypothetical protein
MIQQKLTKPPNSLIKSITSSNKFMIFYKIPMPSINNAMINTGCHTSFRWETKVGFTCRKNTLKGLIGSFIHSIMDLTPSPRLWVTIILSSTLPPFLYLHLVFNVDLIWPYFPPLLDTSEIEEKLTPKNFKPNYME